MDEPAVEIKLTGRKRKKRLYALIRDQMEFYFSDSNLSKDRFLKKTIDASEDGYVDLAIFRNFNKMKAITTDLTVITKALRRSTVLQINEEGSKIKRVTSLVDHTDVDERTIYVQYLPKNVNHEWMKKTFSQYGKVMYVSLPRYQTTGDFKGFGFVEFESKQEVENACRALTQESDNNQEKIGHFPKTSKQLKQLQKQVEKQDIDKGEEAENKGTRRKLQNRDGSIDIVDCETSSSSKIPSAEVGDPNADDKTSCLSKSQIISSSSIVTDPDSVTQMTVKTKESLTSSEEIKKRKRKHTDTNEDDNTLQPESKIRKAKTSESDSDSTKDSKTCLKREKHSEKGKVEVSDRDRQASKRKMEESATEPSKHGIRKIEESDEAGTEPKRVRISDQVEIQCVTEKKKKRRQKKKKPKIEREMPPLRVIPKTEWLCLKKEYLTLQKENMKQLKRLLKDHSEVEQIASHRKKGAHSQVNVTEQEDIMTGRRTLEYTPGVIIKFTTSDPINRKEFKEMLSDRSMISYVDLMEGGHTEGHVRCTDADGAQRLADAAVEGVRFTMLEGETEKLYWDKIKSDQQSKLGSKKKNRRKGKQKIVEKGEKLAAVLSRKQHIVFDD